MAKVWMYNAEVGTWEPLNVGYHDHDQYLTMGEALGIFLYPSWANTLYAPIVHTHDNDFLRPTEILAGTGITVTRTATTVTISTGALFNDEVGVSSGAPSSNDPDPQELYVDTGGTETFALFPTASGGIPGTGGGVSAHGDLTGLANDDHLHYHTDARGDLRYLRNDGTSLISAIPTDPASVANKKYVDDAIDAKVIVSDSPASGIRPAGTVWIEY